jgi:hypothetical protein
MAREGAVSEKPDLDLARRVLEFTANPQDWLRMAKAALDELEKLNAQMAELVHQLRNLETIRDLGSEELAEKNALIRELALALNQVLPRNADLNSIHGAVKLLSNKWVRAALREVHSAINKET